MDNIPESLLVLLRKYLARIGVSLTEKPSLSFLASLQKKHIESFTHDTIDSYFKRKIYLEPVWIIQKFLRENRGGLYFELNGAFVYLLKHLGFTANLTSARVLAYNEREYVLPIDTHAPIIVELDGKKYLVDVGWSDSFREPIDLVEGTYNDFTGDYKIVFHNKYYILHKLIGNVWKEQYKFDLTFKDLSNFDVNLSFVNHSPEHEFNHNLICTQPYKGGHLALVNREVFIINLMGKKNHLLQGDVEVLEILKKQFFISSFVVDSLNFDREEVV